GAHRRLGSRRPARPRCEPGPAPLPAPHGRTFVGEGPAWQGPAAGVSFAASVTLPIAVVGGVPVYLIDQGSTARLGLWVVGLAVLFGLRPAGSAGRAEALTIAATSVA